MEHHKIFNDYLQEHGLRLTRVREIILDAVFATHSHFDAEELYDAVRDKKVSRATVYRTLPYLVASGLVKKSLCADDREKYEHIFGHPNHLHIVCSKCGRLVEQTDKKLEEIIIKTAIRNGFDYQDYNLRITGICALCKNNQS